MKLVILLLAIFSSTLCAETTTNHQRTTGAELIGGSFSLIDQTGSRVTDQDYIGKYRLVFFGFTHCPSVCPLGLQRMVAALSGIENFEQFITPIFISVDPDRDTPKRMTEYLGHFHKSIVGLTGTEAALQEAADAYRVYFSKSIDKNSNAVMYDHSAVIYLMDDKGQYVTHFSNAHKISEMTDMIKRSLAKE
jgi:protein SCO1/2